MKAKSQSGLWECPEQSSPSEENCSLQGLPTSSFPTVHSHRLGAVRGVCMLSCVWLFAIPWTTLAHQVPLSMEFSRQKYWAKLPLPTPGDLPNPGIESESFVSPAFSVWLFFFFNHFTTWEAHSHRWGAFIENALLDLESVAAAGYWAASFFIDSLFLTKTFIHFYLEDNYFTILCWFLPYIDMNHP